MTVLITGFEPFADNAINPSYEAVRRLPDQICGAAVEKRCLPVVFGKAADLLEREIEKICPDIVICTGLAGGRSAITPESVAVNLMAGRRREGAVCFTSDKSYVGLLEGSRDSCTTV